MNNLFFRIVVLLLLNLIFFPLRFEASEIANISRVLGRTDRLDNISDDFEDPNWEYDRQNHISSNRFWRGSPGLKGSDKSDRGDPEILERVTPPKDGKTGSTGALKIGTNLPDDDNNPTQDDLRTLSFEEKLERKLTRIDQPVFIMRIWLPSFDQLEKNHQFGFRLEAQSNDTPNSYYPSIWLRYNHILQRKDRNYVFRGSHFFFRIFYLDGSNMKYCEEYGGPIKQPGWWTIAITFDENGVCYYYARPGVDALSEENKIFDDIQFNIKSGKKALLMDHVNAGLISLGYQKEGNISPRFVIDDYEVWTVKR